MTAFETIKEITTTANKVSHDRKVFLHVTLKSKKKFFDEMKLLFNQNPHAIANASKTVHPQVHYAGYVLFFTQDKKQESEVECRQIEYALN